MKGGEKAMDSAAFEQVYQAYFGVVYRYVLRMTGNPGLAEDITSDTFFKAMTALDTFRGESDIRAWLCRIARNTYLSALRKQRSTVDLAALEETLPAPEPAPEDLLIRGEHAMAIHRALHGLPEPYKEVFTLRTLGEMDFRQIGELFGRTANWACVTYHRARKKLQERMDDP